jgi:hypothetical protein
LPLSRHRHADIGCRESGRVIEAVAHHRWLKSFFSLDGSDLLSGATIRSNLVDAKLYCGRGGRLGIVARYHENAIDADFVQTSQCLGSVGAYGIRHD